MKTISTNRDFIPSSSVTGTLFEPLFYDSDFVADMRQVSCTHIEIFNRFRGVDRTEVVSLFLSYSFIQPVMLLLSCVHGPEMKAIALLFEKGKNVLLHHIGEVKLVIVGDDINKPCHVFMITRQFSRSPNRKYEGMKNWTVRLKQTVLFNLQKPSSPAKTDYCRLLYDAFGKYCAAPFEQRFKNAHKTYTFYRRLYNDFGHKKLITTVIRKIQPSRPVCTFAAAACTFSWEDNGFSDLEIQEHIDELAMLERAISHKESNVSTEIDNENIPTEWETVLDEPNTKIWRMPFKDTEFMQYKVYGRFHDISAKQFFTVQVDLEYRRKWDNLVIDINVVDENRTSGEQVLRWISYFPYPFKAREYVYIRRAKIFSNENTIVLLARSVDHPKCKTSPQHVRVPLYVSDMVIKPHKSMDEPGLDYLLTYCDNPQTQIPSRLSSWVVSAGIPDYVKKLHKASLGVNTIIETNTEPTTNDPPQADSRYELPNFGFPPRRQTAEAY